MKIAYLNTPFRESNANGAATHIREFINETTALGHVIYSGKDNHHPKVIQTPTGLIPRIKTILDCDVVYIRYADKLNKSMLFSQYPLRFLSKKLFLVWEFNSFPDTFETDPDKIAKQSQTLRNELKIANLAICLSNTMAEKLSAEYDFNKILVAPDASNPDHFKPGLPCPKRMRYFEGKTNIVWSGSLSMPWADVSLMLDAAQQLWESHKDKICFHLIGKFDSSLAEKITPNVHIYGIQPYHKLPNWLSAMDIGLNFYKPGKNDFGSPIKFFDYLSSGLAVICSNHPQMREILDEINLGSFVLDDSDPILLTQKILTLHEDPDLLNRFKTLSRNLIIEKYNWKNTVGSIMARIDHGLSG